MKMAFHPGVPLRPLILTFLTVLVVWPLAAQDASIEQSRQFRSGPTDLRDLGEEDDLDIITTAAPTSPGDEELGDQFLLREEERYKYVTAFGETSYYFTDNAFLTESNRDNDAFFVGTGGASFRYPVSDLTTLRASASQSFYRYDQARGLDFDGLDVYAGVNKVFPDLYNIIASADYYYNRLTYAKDNVDGPAGSEFYREHAAIFSLLKVFPFSRAHYAYIGPSATFSWSNPDSAQRDEFTLQTGYHVDITRMWFADLQYRFSLHEYDGSTISRDDINQTVLVQTGIQPWDWVSISASALFGFNNSSNPALNYEYRNLGGTVNLQIQF